MRRAAALGIVAVVGAALLAPAAHSGAATTAAPDRKVIVLLKDSVASSDSVASEQSRTRHARVTQVYGSALQGYAATVPADQIAALQQDSRVEAVVEDKTTKFDKPSPRGGYPQFLPYSIDRIDGELSSAKSGDGRGRVDADVAIIDSGIGPHNDLNVVGGTNCGNIGRRNDYTDTIVGHGTHVAGITGAEDNRRDYVGVAPGVRIWSVKTLTEVTPGEFDATESTVLCGIDWAIKHANIIDVANMSLGFDGTDDGHCGRVNHDPLHRAICGLVRAGVTTVVSAGNENQDAANAVPAAYDEVITVAAMGDFDGIPGGLDTYDTVHDPVYGPVCLVQYGQRDDTRAFFSNYGPDIDLTAPGVCVESTYPLGWNGTEYVPDPDGYAFLSGTSMSSPHVAGAAALYKSKHRWATPAQVKAALLRAGTYDYDNADDPDGIKEPMLNVSGF